MLSSRLAALALLAASAAPAFAGPFTVDFEKDWAYGTDVGDTYANLGVSFVGVGGLSNDADFTYYAGAPSPLGVGYAYTDSLTTAAFMNVASGVAGSLSFAYSTPTALAGAVKAWSGLNGTGELLGTFDFAATGADYAAWNVATFSFAGVAKSFDLSGSANVAALDNISAVPEPAPLALMLAGAAALSLRVKRRRG